MLHLLMLVAVLPALLYIFYNYLYVRKLPEGTERMQEIAKAIRLGAKTFIRYEYKLIAIIGLVIAVILAAFINWQMAVAFLMGALMSALAGFLGMKVATYANVRVANQARQSLNIGKTLKVAYRGGAVMGLSVAGFALAGLAAVFFLFGDLQGQIEALIRQEIPLNHWGIPVPFTVTLSGYALGCSVIAMFARVGGGIYTKAADMGADLVGKTEVHLPEDDPRNPATIADNVGDNVGDVAGLGADLLESFVGAIVAACILACELYFSHAVPIDAALLKAMLIYPPAVAALGLIASMLGIAYLLSKKQVSENPHRELNISTWLSAILTIIGSFALAFVLFKQGFSQAVLQAANLRLGAWSPALCALLGIIAGMLIGALAEYYTSYDYQPTRGIALASKEGVAFTVTHGLAVGMNSLMAPVAVLALAIYLSYLVGGMYGIALAAVGMLSFVAATVAVDSYGPIADNAGGIAEMSKLPAGVRQITDKLDAVGNTTAAIGKGFAIGSAALAATSMMVSYLYTYTPKNMAVTLDLLNPLILAGALVGAALPWLFSSLLINAVTKAAEKMVDEVRRQFKVIKGLLQGEVLPDYENCIQIASAGALKSMRLPALIAVLFPVACGFIFGAEFVAGILIGATISAIVLAIFTGNVGGAWDNAKKFVEIGGVAGVTKGDEVHSATVVGDTVGDPLKDTVGPSLDILIKIMSVVALVAVALFSRYNLLAFLGQFF